MTGATFLVEAYLSKRGADGLEATAACARAAAEKMRREGTPIHFLRSYFLPEDETYFCLYEACSIDDVAEASRRANLAVARIQCAIEAKQGSRRNPGSRCAEAEVMNETRAAHCAERDPIRVVEAASSGNEEES